MKEVLKPMKRKIISVLLALALALTLLPTAAFAADGNEFNVTITGTQKYAYAYNVAEQVNQLRAGLGLSQLVIDPVLMETAMQRAAECAVSYSSSHTRPNGTSCFTAFPDRSWTYKAENIAAGYTTPAAVMDGWTNSPGHYANMTSVNVNAFGVGCFYINGTYYWAQCFTGGAYSSSSARKSDQQATATVPVIKEYFSPAGGTDTISLQVGESYQLPVYTRNPGFYNYATTLSGVDRATLSTGTDLVKLNSNTLTITAVSAGTGTVTLRLPSGDTIPFTVKVSGQSVGESGRFTDVSAGQYYYDAVQWAVENRITGGTGNGKFSPNDNCTRAQIVTFLYRAAGSPAVSSSAKNPFTDVKTGDYYYNAVLWANANNITGGTGGGKFSPNDPCTRAQIVTFLWRAAGRPEPASSKKSFTDVHSGDYYYDAVLWAVAKGITVGDTSTTFAPDAVCTRGQGVTFLYRDRNK